MDHESGREGCKGLNSIIHAIQQRVKEWQDQDREECLVILNKVVNRVIEEA